MSQSVRGLKTVCASVPISSNLKIMRLWKIITVTDNFNFTNTWRSGPRWDPDKLPQTK